MKFTVHVKTVTLQDHWLRLDKCIWCITRCFHGGGGAHRHSASCSSSPSLQAGVSLLEARGWLQRQGQERQGPHNHRCGQRQRRHRHLVSSGQRGSEEDEHFLPHSLSLFQASNRKDEQGDAGDGRIVWPIRSFKRAGVGWVSGCGRRWAGPSQEESPGHKEPHQWLGPGRPERLMQRETPCCFLLRREFLHFESMTHFMMHLETHLCHGSATCGSFYVLIPHQRTATGLFFTMLNNAGSLSHFFSVVLWGPFLSYYSVNSLICIYQNLLLRGQFSSLRLVSSGSLLFLHYFVPYLRLLCPHFAPGSTKGMCEAICLLDKQLLASTWCVCFVVFLMFVCPPSRALLCLFAFCPLRCLAGLDCLCSVRHMLQTR